MHRRRFKNYLYSVQMGFGKSSNQFNSRSRYF